MELKFTPRTIHEIEQGAKNQPVQNLLDDLTLKNMVLFVKKGMNIDEAKALDEIEAFLAEGNDTIGLYNLIMESLQASGFLPRKLNLKKIQEEMSRMIEKGISAE